TALGQWRRVAATSERRDSGEQQAADPVDRGRQEQEQAEGGIRPAVENVGDERQDEIAQALRSGEVERQRDRQEAEEEEVRAEDHGVSRRLAAERCRTRAAQTTRCRRRKGKGSR